MREKEVDKIITTVCDHFEISEGLLKSGYRRHPVPLAKRIILHLLPTLSIEEKASAINSSRYSVYHFQDGFDSLAKVDLIIKSHIEQIQSKLADMTINLNKSQLKAFYEVLTDYLGYKKPNVEAQLVALHLDDIREKVRKRIRADKENVGFDEKQVRAFLVFHLRCSPEYEHRNPYGYSTLLYIIQQIKPESLHINLIE